MKESQTQPIIGDKNNKDFESLCFDCGAEEKLITISPGVALCSKCYTSDRVERKKVIKEYPLLNQKGYISFENDASYKGGNLIKGILGIQVAANGKVWVCVNGVSILRFRPELKKED